MPEVSLEEINSLYDEITEHIIEDLSLSSEANDELRRYQDQLLDIRTVIDQMMDSDGVSRGMVAALESHLPEDLPLQSFTRTPTRTNFEQIKVSLEERNWGLIATIGIAIAGLIARIIMWIFDRKSASGGAEKNAEAAEKVAKLNAKTADELEAPKRKTVEEEINEEANRGYTRFHELCTMYPDRDTISLFTEGEEILGRGALLSVITDALEVVKSQAPLKTLRLMDKDLTGSIESLSLYKQGNGRNANLSKAFSVIKDRYTAMKDEPPSKPFDIVIYNKLHEEGKGAGGIVQQLRAERRVNIDAKKYANLRKRLETIESELRDLNKNDVGEVQLALHELKELVDLREVIMKTINHAVSGILSYIGLREELVAGDQKFYPYLTKYRDRIKDAE